MTFNWPIFWTRAITALIFVAVMAAGFLCSESSFLILISGIHFGCWYEYLKLINKIHKVEQHPLLGMGVSLLGYHLVLLFAKFDFLGYCVAAGFSLPVLVAGLVLAVLGVFKERDTFLKACGTTALGFVYISLSLALFLHLRLSDYSIICQSGVFWNHNSGFYLPIIIILAIWINDTMAYLVGSAIGKTPFSKISPKKTIEGTTGGMLLCVGCITVGLKPFFQWHILLGIALLVAIFGTVGDLVESKLKRMAGVKDSGRIMPGHGGFLDRFDSLLVAVPFVWLLIVWLA